MKKKVQKKTKNKLSDKAVLLIALLAILIVIFVATLIARWHSDQPSPLMVKIQSELSALNLPNENLTKYSDDSGCNRAYDGIVYCRRTASYGYSTSLTPIKASLMESFTANGWLPNDAIRASDTHIFYVKNTERGYLCLTLTTDAPLEVEGYPEFTNQVVVAAAEDVMCKGDLRWREIQSGVKQSE